MSNLAEAGLNPFELVAGLQGVYTPSSECTIVVCVDNEWVESLGESEEKNSHTQGVTELEFKETVSALQGLYHQIGTVELNSEQWPVRYISSVTCEACSVDYQTPRSDRYPFAD